MRLAGLVVMGCLALGLPAAAFAVSSPPEVQIEPAEQTSTGFMLKAKVNPEGSATTYYFIYKQADAVECEDLEGCGPTTPQGGPLTGDTQQEVRAEVTGLVPGQQYRYWLIARNASPEAVRSRELTFTTPPTGAPPSEVVTGSAEATQTGYKLTGKLNPGGLPTTYYYEYIGSNEVECLNMEPGLERCWHQTAHVGPITGDTQQEVPPVEVTGLTVGVTYHYRLVANNADRTVFGDEASFTVTANGAPSEVVTEPAEATPNGFRLRGKLNPDGLPTTYYFIYKDTGVECEDLEGCGPETPHVGPVTGDTQQEVPAIEVTGLAPGQQYRYWLIARNARGTERGGEVFFTTPPEGHNSTSRQTKQEPKSEPPAPLVTPLTVTSPPIKTTTTKPESLTKAQKLADALKACERKPTKQRAACEKQARKKYSAAVSTGRRQSVIMRSK